MKRRVVVTGLGAVTPIGNTVDVFWDEIKKGTVGIGPPFLLSLLFYAEKQIPVGWERPVFFCCNGFRFITGNS